MLGLYQTLTEIASIGVQIARLQERSKILRMSLMDHHYESIPKSFKSATVAQAVVGTRMFQILPVFKDDDPAKKLTDVTVTFDEVLVVQE